MSTSQKSNRNLAPIKVAIVGAGGFVGKRLVRNFAMSGHRVVALIRRSYEESDAKYFDSELVDTKILDLSDFELHELPTDVDAIISLAQSSDFREFPNKALDIFEVNVNSHLKILDWAVKNEIRQCIYVSSGGIYGGKMGAEFLESELIAVDSPLGFYLGSKLCAEIITQNYAKFFKSLLIFRPFFIYGPGQRSDMLIPRLIQNIRNDREIELQGEDGLHLNPIFVEDVAELIFKGINLSGTRVINLAGPDIVSLREISEIIASNLDRRPRFKFKEGDPTDYVGNISTLSKMFEFQLTSFSRGMKITLP